jgi:FkbM family methyltransferase
MGSLPVYASFLKETGERMHAIVEKVFCGDHNGEESFIAFEGADAGKASKYARKTGGKETRVTVPCRTLDSIVESHRLSGPYVIKIDVEGAELDVLRGARNALRGAEAVIIEGPVIPRKAGAASFGTIVSFLTGEGFSVFDLAELSYHRRNGFLNLSNIIFVRSENKLWEEKAVFRKKKD